MIVGCLHQQPAPDALEVEIVVTVTRRDREHAYVRFGAERCARFSGELRRDNDFDKLS